MIEKEKAQREIITTEIRKVTKGMKNKQTNEQTNKQKNKTRITGKQNG